MYPNLMELKVYYEMKKEEMEKAVMANKYLKKDQKGKVYRFLNIFKKNPEQKKSIVPKTNCRAIKNQKGCCEN